MVFWSHDNCVACVWANPPFYRTVEATDCETMTFVEINPTHFRSIAQDYDVRGMPRFMILRDGEMVHMEYTTAPGRIEWLANTYRNYKPEPFGVFRARSDAEFDQLLANAGSTPVFIVANKDTGA